MKLNNLVIDHMAVHEIFQRRIHNTPISPRYGTGLTILDDEAMNVFRDRVVDALGSSSKSMEMEVADFSDSSASQIADDAIKADIKDFPEVTKRFADKLTSSQTALNLPGGIMVIFSGSSGHPSKPVIGLVKADVHGGFRRNSLLEVEYIRDLFLTPNTRLYKIALFRKLN